MREFDAVVAGYLGVDLAPGFAGGEAAALGQLLRPGKLVEVGPLEISPGGVVANTGLAMARFGMRVALMGLVGQDPLGELLLGLLEGRGATLDVRRTEVAGTAYGIVIAPPGTDRVFLECPGCNATFGADDIDYEAVAKSRLFHFGYPPLMERFFADDGAELEAMFRRVKGLGVMTSLDMTLPDPQGPAGQVNWERLLAWVLPLVDIFTPSVEELLYMLAPGEWERLTGEGDAADLIPERRVEELAAQTAALGAGTVLLKIGQRGALLRTSEGQVRLEASPIEPDRVCNACGAGDAAVAGFLTAILRGESPEKSGRIAMIAGRDSLCGVDTTAGLRAWEEMETDAGR